MGEATDDLAERLARMLGAPVSELVRLSGGASRQTWAFTVGGRHLVLQLQQAVAADRPGIGPVGEAELLGAARAGGVPVAPVVDASAGEAALGMPYLLMEAVEGETIARRILRDDGLTDARALLAAQCGSALAALHRLPPDAVDGLDQPDPLDQQREALDLLGEPHPALELGLRWLDQHRPSPTAGGPRIVHGDFRLGNLIVGPDGLAAVIDWELAHLGDPMEDLGWLCVRAWRFGSDKPVAGVGEYAELFHAYQRAGGQRADPGTVRWWELFGTVRWGVICIMQAAGHLSGVVRSHELAAIGRRVSQTEYDVLTMLRKQTLDASAGGETVAWDGAPHDRPSVPELVAAVREWLEADVMTEDDRRLRFHARVAVNMLAMVERELAVGPAQRQEHERRLTKLGVSDDADLAGAVRAGRFDGDRWDEAVSSVSEAVLDKLAVADPGYPTRP